VPQLCTYLFHFTDVDRDSLEHANPEGPGTEEVKQTASSD